MRIKILILGLKGNSKQIHAINAKHRTLGATQDLGFLTNQSVAKQNHTKHIFLSPVTLSDMLIKFMVGQVDLYGMLMGNS